LNGVDKPALPLQRISQVLRLVKSAPHRSHAINEIPDWLTGFVAFEVSEYLVAVLYDRNLVQRDVEEPVYVIVGIPGGHRSDDFVEVQIVKAVGHRVNTLRRIALREQDAGQTRHLSFTCLLP
jgi:hypothetical protein